MVCEISSDPSCMYCIYVIAGCGRLFYETEVMHGKEGGMHGWSIDILFCCVWNCLVGIRTRKGRGAWKHTNVDMPHSLRTREDMAYSTSNTQPFRPPHRTVVSCNYSQSSTSNTCQVQLVCQAILTIQHVFMRFIPILRIRPTP